MVASVNAANASAGGAGGGNSNSLQLDSPVPDASHLMSPDSPFGHKGMCVTVSVGERFVL